MKLLFKKIIISLLITICMLSCDLFSFEVNARKLDIGKTSYRFEKSPNELFSGRFLVIGDSYAVLMVENTVEYYNYVVHAGYDINKIYFELLPLIQSNEFDYAFLFLGPNDFMEQVDPKEFMFVLGLVVDILKSKGIMPILTDYVDPHYEYKVYSGLKDADYNYMLYDTAVKEIVLGREVLYVPYEDLFRHYGYRSENDLVHPNDKVHEHLLKRVIAKIKEDQIKNPKK